MPSRSHAGTRNGGFTMVELMFVVAVSLILLGIGLPSFSNLVKQNRITASVNDVITGFQLARSEAAKRGEPVRVCPTTVAASATDAAADCSGTDWHAGALAFVDGDGDGARSNDEELLYVRGRMGADVFVNASDSVANGLTYGGDGFPTNLINDAQLVFCDTEDDQKRRRVVSLSTTGRPVTARTITVEGGLEC